MKWTTIIIILLTTSAAASANDIGLLMIELNQKTNNSSMYQNALVAGKERATLCTYCHGEDGNSRRDYIPNLAQQNAQYLIKQFEYFRDGTRKDYVMSNMAKNLSLEDRVNIALYYSSQQVKPRLISSDASVLKHGKNAYDKMCSSCHGTNGHGENDLPRISGQPAPYIEHTLNDYRANSKRRPNSPMIAIAESLSDEDISALSAYVASLP